MTTNIPNDKTFIQATNDPIDISKNYDVEYPLLGDAKLIIRQMIEACKDRLGGGSRDGETAEEIASVRQAWLGPVESQAELGRGADDPVPG